MWNPDPIWTRWRDLTRLLVGLDAASEAFVAEWMARGESPESVMKIRWRGRSDFESPAGALIQILSNKDHIGQTLLVHSYAIFEGFGLQVLSHLKSEGLVTGEPESLIESGIEAWTSLVLKGIDLPWSKVRKSRLGLMEAAFARNAIAHGFFQYTERYMKRCATLKIEPTWSIGDPIPVDFSTTLELRYRLQCYMRVVCQKIKNDKGG